MARKKSAAPRGRTKPARNAAITDKGIHDIKDKSVLDTRELAHGPNMDDRSDVIDATHTTSPKSPIPDTGDEGMEPGRPV